MVLYIHSSHPLLRNCAISLKVVGENVIPFRPSVLNAKAEGPKQLSKRTKEMPGGNLKPSKFLSN